MKRTSLFGLAMLTLVGLLGLYTVACHRNADSLPEAQTPGNPVHKYMTEPALRLLPAIVPSP